MSGDNHGETEINTADRLGTLVSYGISAPFFVLVRFCRTAPPLLSVWNVGKQVGLKNIINLSIILEA